MPEKQLYNVYAVHPRWSTRLEADALLTEEEASVVKQKLLALGYDEVFVIQVFPPDGPMEFDEVVAWFCRQR